MDWTWLPSTGGLVVLVVAILWAFRSGFVVSGNAYEQAKRERDETLDLFRERVAQLQEQSAYAEAKAKHELAKLSAELAALKKAENDDAPKRLIRRRG